MAEIGRVEALKREVARLERGRRAEMAAALPFGIAPLDARLPGGGLALGALHEVSGLGPDEEDGTVAAAFIAGIAARLPPARPVLWCQPASAADLYGPGLAACGLRPERLLLARPRTATDLLWAMEEGLRTRSLAAVIGELDELPGPASRRLQLAAENSGVTAFVLRRVRVRPQDEFCGTNPITVENKGKFLEMGSLSDPIASPLRGEGRNAGPPRGCQPNAAVTRWQVASLPGAVGGEPGVGRPLWRLNLWRCRGGAPGEWIVEASDATGHVALPAALGDGAARERWRVGV